MPPLSIPPMTLSESRALLDAFVESVEFSPGYPVEEGLPSDPTPDDEDN